MGTPPTRPQRHAGAGPIVFLRETGVNPLLSRAIGAIERERLGGFKESYGYVEQLIGEYGELGIADRLVNEIPASIAWEVVADMLAMLIWVTADNGSEIMRSAERWLREGSDLRKINIGLALDAYPFADAGEMARVLDGIARAHPDVAAKCQELIDGRRKIAG